MQPKPLPVDSWLQLLATTQGRDKFYRTIQYFARFLAYYLSKTHATLDLAKRLQLLSVAVVFRIGKPLDHLQVILRALQGRDETVKLLIIGKATGLGGWLLLDSLQWIHGTGFAKFDSIDSINKNAPRLWAIGLSSSLMLNLYKLQSYHVQTRVRAKLSEDEKGVKGELAALAKDHIGRQLAMDCIQDLIDLIIPLSLMGALDVSPGVVGLAGTITSIMGAATLWPK